MAEISVIIPVYNAEKYIAGCLDALCAQTFGDIEVLCVDDGSTDGSGSILAEYAGKDPRIRVFPQANSGPAAARNLGLKNAGGRYVMFCDADDSYRPDCCERMLRAMTEKRPDVAVCRCRAFPKAASMMTTLSGCFIPCLQKTCISCRNVCIITGSASIRS